jgi:hypothetical protein
MADTRQRTTLGNRFRFLVRAVGLTGFAAAAAGGILAVATFPAVDFGSWSGWSALPDVLRAAGDGANGELAKVAAWMVAGGVVAVAVALLVEVAGALVLGVGRRTAAGTTATVGVAAAVALLVIVNVYSLTHYRRIDTTREQRFTLPPDLAAEFGKLRSTAPTTIVVHQTHNFGPLMPTRDSFTKADEAEVTARVLDLVDQFREFGPQFKVVVLDKEAFEYRREMKALRGDAPELVAAIESTPENSVFFYANKRVQRLAFNEFMQLDRTASDTEDEAKANLVLVPQGIDRFARRILAVQERRPKVAVCVVHEALSTARSDGWRARYTMSGLRKVLTDAGFDVTDIVLKKGFGQPGGLKPAADTREESTLERLEAEQRGATKDRAAAARNAVKWDDRAKAVADAKGKPWAERKALYDKHLADLFQGTLVEEIEPQLLEIVERGARRARDKLAETVKKQEEIAKQVTEALKNERALEMQRMSDVAAKFKSQLADVDLLIVPRFTTDDAMEGVEVPPSLHALDKEQTKVVKEFMKSGRPVLTCLGPVTPEVNFDPRIDTSLQAFSRRWATELERAMNEPAEDFERMLAQRGIELGRTMVVFDGETKALAADRFGSGPVEIPSVVFNEDPVAAAGIAPNPILAAIRQTGRTTEQAFDLRLRAVRPVGVGRTWQARQPFAAEFMFTSADAWNTWRPFPIRVGRNIAYVPEFDPPSDDPSKGTRDEEKRGPFPIAVAIENRIPLTWMSDDVESWQLGALLLPLTNAPALGLTRAAEEGDRPTQRTVVFGSGSVFTGKDLSPVQEKVLLHTVNWLTRREDRLPRPASADNPDWHYPRVALSDRDRILWRLGTIVGLPLAVAYVGLIVTMRRRMR